jgi:hypothetical protein
LLAAGKVLLDEKCSAASKRKFQTNIKQQLIKEITNFPVIK